jgi:hypothetical protein
MSDEEIPEEVENFEADWDLEDTQQAQGVQPIQVEGMGSATAELIDFGTIEYYRRRNQNSAETRGEDTEDGEAELSPEQMAEIFANQYVSPDFSGLSGDDVRDMKPLAPSRMLEALMGDDVEVEANADGSVNVSESGNEN